MKGNAVIVANRVKKTFNAHNHIGVLDIEVQKGEIFALCGGNGAGKSTVIQMMIGQLQPTEGTISIAGKTLKTHPQAFKSYFSYMPDAMAFPKVLTGLEILTFFASLSEVPSTRAEQLLKRVGLWEERNKRVKDYSKGMQQRLALAQALLPQAPVLILDEPTNGLDPFWVKEFKDIIREEKANGTTILFSTHILADVEELADTICFMNEGKVLALDRVEKMRENRTGGPPHRLEDVFFQLVIAEAK